MNTCIYIYIYIYSDIEIEFLEELMNCDYDDVDTWWEENSSVLIRIGKEVLGMTKGKGPKDKETWWWKAANTEENRKRRKSEAPEASLITAVLYFGPYLAR